MSYVAITFPRLVLALGLVVIAILVSRRERLGLEKELAWGALRGAVQLLAIGYVLLLLFSNEKPWWVLSALLVMLLVAAWTSSRRVEHGPSSRILFGYAFAAISAGSAVALIPVFVLVVPPKPWFEARYLVPIGGMMIANAMNVVALVFERVFQLARSESYIIEQLLALGASPRQALAPHARIALRAAMIPTINGLLTVGLVALPGMMTGQILSGTAPEEAVRYQIVIMYQLVVVAAVSGYLATVFARRLLFNPRDQLRELGNPPGHPRGR